MNGVLIGLKYRNLGSKEYNTAVVWGETLADAKSRFYKEIVEDEWSEVDKRTISWAGSSVPLSIDGLIVFHGVNLDKHT